MLNPQRRDELRRELVEAYTSDPTTTIRGLAARTGLSYGTVRTLLRDTGIVLRPRGARPRPRQKNQ